MEWVESLSCPKEICKVLETFITAETASLDWKGWREYKMKESCWTPNILLSGSRLINCSAANACYLAWKKEDSSEGWGVKGWSQEPRGQRWEARIVLGFETDGVYLAPFQNYFGLVTLFYLTFLPCLNQNSSYIPVILQLLYPSTVVCWE